MWQKHCLFSNLFLSRPCTASCQSRSQGETNDGAIVECVLLYKGSDESFLPVMWCRLGAMTYWICNVCISSPPRWLFLVPVVLVPMNPGYWFLRSRFVMNCTTISTLAVKLSVSAAIYYPQADCHIARVINEKFWECIPRSRQLISKVEAMLVCWGKTTPLSMDFYCDFIPLFPGNYGEFTFE